MAQKLVLISMFSVFLTNIFFLFKSFLHQNYLIVFFWSLSDSNSPQVSRTLHSTLADLNNAVVWKIFTRSLISKSSSPCTNPLVTVPTSLITISTKVEVLILLFTFFQFHSWVNRDNFASSLFVFVDYY